MNISRMNSRIIVQKNTVTVDRYQNHVNVWIDYFSCAAYASTYAAKETGNEITSEERSVTFCCRYCPELAVVSSTGYRIVFQDEVYNIQSVDAMNYQKDEIRFTCARVHR